MLARELADFAGADLAAPFDAGPDAPRVGDPEEPLAIDAGEAAGLAAWFGLGWALLDRLTATAAEPAAIQLWPEHFDAGCPVAVGRGDDARCRPRGLARRRPVPEPYLYVGPWAQRPPRGPGLLERGLRRVRAAERARTRRPRPAVAVPPGGRRPLRRRRLSAPGAWSDPGVVLRFCDEASGRPGQRRLSLVGFGAQRQEVHRAPCRIPAHDPQDDGGRHRGRHRARRRPVATEAAPVDARSERERVRREQPSWRPTSTSSRPPTPRSPPPWTP